MFRGMHCCFGKKMKETLKQEIIKEIREVVIPDVIQRLNETYDVLQEYEIDLENKMRPILESNEPIISATTPPSIATMSM